MNSQLDSGLASLIILMRFNNIKITQQEIEHISDLHTSKFGDFDIMSTAKSFKLSAKFRKVSIKDLREINRPVIVKNNNGEYFIVAKILEDKVMILYPDKRSPETVDIDEFQSYGQE